MTNTDSLSQLDTDYIAYFIKQTTRPNHLEFFCRDRRALKTAIGQKLESSYDGLREDFPQQFDETVDICVDKILERIAKTPTYFAAVFSEDDKITKSKLEIHSNDHKFVRETLSSVRYIDYILLKRTGFVINTEKWNSVSTNRNWFASIKN